MNRLCLLGLLAASAMLAQNVTHTYTVQTADDARASQVRQLVQDVIGNRVQLDWFPALRAIVLKGPQDAVDASEALLKKWDIPARQVEFTAYIVRASKTKPANFFVENGLVKAAPGTAETPAPLPAALSPAVDQIKQVFGYQWLELIDTAITRTSSRAEFSSGMAGTNGTYQITYADVSVSNDGKVVNVPRFAFFIHRSGAVRLAGRGQQAQTITSTQESDITSSIENEVTIHGDERLVLGKLRLPNGVGGDIFVVLTAKPL